MTKNVAVDNWDDIGKLWCEARGRDVKFRYVDDDDLVNFLHYFEEKYHCPEDNDHTLSFAELSLWYTNWRLEGL